MHIEEDKGISAYKRFYGEELKIVRFLRKFGEMAIVTFRKGSTGRFKTDNKGRACVMVGYSLNHPDETYQMFDMKTKKVIISRDVRWLNKNY